MRILLVHKFFCGQFAHLAAALAAASAHDVVFTVAYTARGLEPCRGFPQFLQAITIIQQRQPEVHAQSSTAPIASTTACRRRGGITADVTGLLADFRGPCAIAECVMRALADPDLACRVSAAARRQAVDRFALGVLLPRQLDLQKRVAEDGAARCEDRPDFTKP